jgi:hypothetical protein
LGEWVWGWVVITGTCPEVLTPKVSTRPGGDVGDTAPLVSKPLEL